MTILKLLKLLYFAHGWYLIAREGALLRNSFEAWKLGPVLPIVYRAFDGTGDNPIRTRALQFNVMRESWEPARAVFDDFDMSFLRWVYVSYCKYDAFQLSDLTHAPDSPWSRVWEAGKRNVLPGMKITDDEIKRYFSILERSHVGRS